MRWVNANGSANASLIGRSKTLLLTVNGLLFGVNRMHAALAHGVCCCELLFDPLPPFKSCVQLHIRSLLLFAVVVNELAAPPAAVE